MNQKSIIAFLIVIIAILLAVVMYLLGASKASAPIQPTVTQDVTPKNSVPTAQPQPVSTSAKIVYTNNEFGFKINFPADWEKYKAVAVKEPNIKGITSVHFFMPTADKEWPTEESPATHEKLPGYASTLVVSIWDKALWDKEKNSTECKNDPNPGCPFESEVVAKNEKYVYTISLGQAYPNDSPLFKLDPQLGGEDRGSEYVYSIVRNMFEIIR